MDLVLVVLAASTIAALVVVLLVAWRKQDNEVIDLVAFESESVEQSYEDLSRRSLTRLLHTLDVAFDRCDPPSDATAVLTVVTTIAGRAVGPDVLTAPVLRSGNDRRPWSVVEAGGLERLRDVAEESPADIERTHAELVSRWVLESYNTKNPLDQATREDSLRAIRAVGDSAYEALDGGLSVEDVLGANGIVASLILVATTREPGQADVEAAMVKVLGSQTIDPVGRPILWREEVRTAGLEVPILL